MSDSKIKSKIQALIAKAQGTSNEHEAEAFMAKAMQLLQEHQLDLADLGDAADPIIERVGVKGAASGHVWKWKLMYHLAVYYGCQSIHCPVYVAGKDGKRVMGYEQRLIGPESAVTTLELMYPWICDQVRTSAKEIALVTGMSEQGQAKRVATALIIRVNALNVAARAKAAPVTRVAANALQLLDQVQAKFKELYPDVKDKRTGQARSDRMSREAAQGIGLSRQMGGADQLRLS